MDATPLQLSVASDDSATRKKYRPFLLPNHVAETDWISRLELAQAEEMVRNDLEHQKQRIRVLVLYGSLRARSYSRLLAYEISRILHRLGCDTRVFDPRGLPVKDDTLQHHEKVQELRELSRWSDGHFWVSPEMHGNLTGVFKNQIDWIPLSTGSIRPTQGRTLGLAMVSGGSQSFNCVNSLRMLGRWMRMFTIPNQSSIPKAYEMFTPSLSKIEEESEGRQVEVEREGGSRLMAGSHRDRVVDCVEEFVKYTLIMREHLNVLNDRYSERQQAVSSGKTAASTNGVELKKI